MKTILALLLLLSSSAFALTGNELLARCSPGATESHTGFCYGYLDGLTDGAAEIKYFCLPDRVTLGQLKSVFLKYAIENPSVLHLPAGAVAGAAFIVAFPCKAKPTSERRL